MLKSSTLAAILLVALMQPASALQQSPNQRASRPIPADTVVEESATLESIVPREGLQFYFEMRSAGLAEVARAETAMVPLSKLLAAGPLKLTTGDLATFVMSNAGALSNAKLTLVGYGSGGAAAVIGAANAADAEQLSAAAAKLLGSNRMSGKAATNDVIVSVRGRTVLAGAQTVVARLAGPNSERTLADDQEFIKARARFSEDAFFAFVELGAGTFGLPGNATDAAQAAGALAALSGMPYAIAVGGSLEGDAANVHALLMNGAKPSSGVFGGLFSSLTSSASSGQSIAASFAAPDADVFVDLMIDWDKLLDAIQSMFGMFAGEVATDRQQLSGGVQSADLRGMAEASLGLSFMHDLIPTLGNELAITLSGFNNLSPQPASAGQTTNGAVKRGSPRFMLMLAVRDQAKFEILLVKLLNGPTGTAPHSLVRTSYRGATINSSKDFAYTITDGFLLAGGSAAEIRHAIDAHAIGNSLASTAEFRQAMGDSRQATLRAYLSSRLSKELSDSLLKEAAKSGGALEEVVQPASQTALPIGVSMVQDQDGLLIEARLPANLAVMALASILNARPASFGISSSPGGGVSDSSSRRSGGRATPKLTDDDIRIRRP
jgi:hypothetical protein